MASEPIGKDCDCIFSFERHYILLALDGLLDKSSAQMKETKDALNEASEEEKKGILYRNLQGSEEIYKHIMTDVNVVKERVSGMKICD